MQPPSTESAINEVVGVSCSRELLTALTALTIATRGAIAAEPAAAETLDKNSMRASTRCVDISLVGNGDVAAGVVGEAPFAERGRSCRSETT